MRRLPRQPSPQRPESARRWRCSTGCSRGSDPARPRCAPDSASSTARGGRDPRKGRGSRRLPRRLGAAGRSALSVWPVCVERSSASNPGSAHPCELCMIEHLTGTIGRMIRRSWRRSLSSMLGPDDATVRQTTTATGCARCAPRASGSPARSTMAPSRPARCSSSPLLEKARPGEPALAGPSAPTDRPHARTALP